MARLIRKAKQYGFTLVELLIVVAIIGVLSTVGIPSFRRMVQKSKKSEAKVNLGGIYTAEQAFFSEYGAFGNALGRIGFVADGQPNTFYYTIGFPQGGGCANQAVAPAVGTTVGKSINATYPAYYNNPNIGPFTRVGYADAGFALAGCGDVVNSIAKVLDPAKGQVGVYVGTAGDVPDRFVAVAAGVIAPGLDKNDVSATKADYWGIDQARVLKNTVDGVR